MCIAIAATALTLVAQQGPAIAGWAPARTTYSWQDANFQPTNRYDGQATLTVHADAGNAVDGNDPPTQDEGILAPSTATAHASVPAAVGGNT